MTNYDLIVIGGGCGGLTAAACAAKEGKKVLLLEKNDSVGGTLSTFTRGRFEFDIGVRSVIGATKNGGDVKSIFDFLNISDRIHWYNLRESFRVITRAHDGAAIDAVLPFGEEAFTAAMEKYVPGSRRSIERLFKLFSEVYGGFLKISEANAEISAKDFKQLKKEYGNFVRTAAYSVDEVFERLQIPQKARDILNTMWLYYCVPAKELNFSQYALYMYTFITQGAAFPKNGGYEIPIALSEVIEEHGGEIRCLSPADRIIIENNKATAVLLKNGEKLSCNKIICNCSPYTAYAKMIKRKNVPDSAVKRTNASNLCARAACVYIGLNRSPEELGIKDYSVYITPTADSSELFSHMKTLNMNNTVIAVCPNTIIPDRSPQGTCVLTLTTLYTDNCWGNVESEEYFREKEALAERLISIYESATGNTIRDNIEELEVATPLTFANHLGTPQGVTHGYRSDNHNSLISRLSTEKADNDIDGTVFCGGWGTQLSGVHASIASGRNAFYSLFINETDKNEIGETEVKA